MIGCLGTIVRKQPIIVLYFETVLKFYNLEARGGEFDPGPVPFFGVFDHEIISTAILLPSPDPRRVVVSRA